MAIVKAHKRNGKVVKSHYRRGKPGRIVKDKKSVKTVPRRDMRTGRLWGRTRV